MVLALINAVPISFNEPIVNICWANCSDLLAVLLSTSKLCVMRLDGQKLWQVSLAQEADYHICWRPDDRIIIIISSDHTLFIDVDSGTFVPGDVNSTIYSAGCWLDGPSLSLPSETFSHLPHLEMIPGKYVGSHSSSSLSNPNAFDNPDALPIRVRASGSTLLFRPFDALNIARICTDNDIISVVPAPAEYRSILAVITVSRDHRLALNLYETNCLYDNNVLSCEISQLLNHFSKLEHYMNASVESLSGELSMRFNLTKDFASAFEYKNTGVGSYNFIDICSQIYYCLCQGIVDETFRNQLESGLGAKVYLD